MTMKALRAKGQITVPSDILKAAHLQEGDPVEFVLTAEGVLMRPKKIIDSTQAWFWTPAWQAGEAEASADIEAGRVERFETDEDFLASFTD
jgi:AbrB family looped-hinge helix DNA binding protein